MPFIDSENVPEILFRGQMKRILNGSNMQLLVDTLPVGQKAPPHKHETEQLTIMVRGSCEVRLGTETRRVNAGDIIFVPPWEEHELLDTFEEVFAIDVFAPPKPDED